MIAWFVIAGLVYISLALAYALAEMRKKYNALQAQNQEAQRILSFKQTLVSRLEVSKRECYDRLRQLGFESLEEYQRSNLWLQAKQRYRDSDYPQYCLVCNADEVEFHHRTYARLGEEELFDLVPLCSAHHKQLHELLDQDFRLCVKDTHDYLSLLREEECTGTVATQEKKQDEGCRVEMSLLPSRAGKPWSAEEDAELLRCFDQKMTVEEMAERLRRGSWAIEVRLFKLGRLSVEQGWRG